MSIIGRLRSYFHYSLEEKLLLLSMLSIILSNLLVMEGMFFSSDCANYARLTEIIIKGTRFYLSPSDNPDFQWVLEPTSHRYYLQWLPGYSIMAVPFVWVVNLFGGSIAYGMRLFNIILMAVSVYLAGALCYRITEDEKTAFLSSLLFLIGTFVLQYAIDTWAHTSSLFFTLSAIYTIVRFSETMKRSYLIFSSLSCGFAFFCRPSEIAVIVPVVAAFMLLCRGKQLENLKIFVISFLFSLLPLLLYDLNFFGSPIHPYFSKEKLSLEYLPNALKNYYTTSDVKLFYKDLIIEPSSLIQSSPFFVLVPFSLSYAKKGRGFYLLLLWCIVSSVVSGLSIHWHGDWGLNFRYLTTILPFLSISSAMVVHNLVQVKDRIFISATLVSFLVLLWVESKNIAGLFALGVEAWCNRSLVNSLNAEIGVCLLLAYIGYLFLRKFNVPNYMHTGFKGLIFGIVLVSIFGAVLNNLYVNCITNSYGGRVFPYMKIVYNLLFSSQSGLGWSLASIYPPSIEGLTKMPLFYHFVFFAPFVVIGCILGHAYPGVKNRCLTYASKILALIKPNF